MMWSLSYALTRNPDVDLYRIFIPDFTDGRVIVVDVANRRLIARPEVLPAGIPFELVAQGPFMFFNDPDSSRAGAIRLGLTSRGAAKAHVPRAKAGIL
ncbi:hypothetical protein [Parafrankia sp. BMG5.11]|nr:hypothetical protein [Parafrankia sp. BMG5.11]TCJ31708.1 hypothetical protein E0504_46995 [Parafrankia sp. BMG5.11]SQD93559.1 hypothetical protein FMEAI12_1730002 [Parafrankia sp. Ea1.12]